jgi:hypothetical protein
MEIARAATPAVAAGAVFRKNGLATNIARDCSARPLTRN